MKVNSLQSLRAIAFLAILLAHSNITRTGAFGVSVFVILSGFLMSYNYYEKEVSTSVKDVLVSTWKRIWKLYPLHIITMIIGALADIQLLLGNFNLDFFKKDLLFLFCNVTLIQAWIPSEHICYSFNGVSWYLSVMVFLYFCFPYIHRLLKKKSVRQLAVSMIIVYALQMGVAAIANNVFDDVTAHLITYNFPLYRVGDFYIGMCLGKIYKKRKLDSSSVSMQNIIAFISIALFAITYYLYMSKAGIAGIEAFRDNIWYIPVSVLLVITFASDKNLLSKVFTNRLFIWIGNLSAYAFLIHQVTGKYIIILFAKCNYEVMPVVLFICSFIVTMTISLFWQLLMKRGTKLHN